MTDKLNFIKDLSEISVKDKVKYEKNRSHIFSMKVLQPNAVIQEIYKKGEIVVQGKKEKLTSAVSPLEGYHLYWLIKANRYKLVIEVGLANGLSSLYMLQAMKENRKGRLISVDPFQKTQWKSAGLDHIAKAKLQKYHRWVAEKSFIGLPMLLAEGLQADLVFVDGMHLFDYTLLDVFFAVLLCRVGGVIVVDDINHAGVKKCIDYMLHNYSSFLKFVPQTLCRNTAATFIKVKEDQRAWNFHAHF